MAMHGMTKAVMKRNSLGERPWLSGRMEQEPMCGSRPKRPHLPSQVATSAPKPHTQVQPTMRPRYWPRYSLQQKAD